MFLLILVALAYSVAGNQTDAITRGGFKYFHSVNSDDNVDAIHLARPIPTVPPSYIWSVIRDLVPGLLHRPPVSDINHEDKIPIESSEGNNNISNKDSNNINNREDECRENNVLLRRIFDGRKSKPERRRYDIAKTSNNRRIMDWFSTVLGLRATSNAEFKSIEQTALKVTTKLTILLTRLNDLLERLNENISKLHSEANKTTSFYIVKMPTQSNIYERFIKTRRKRDSLNGVNEKEHVIEKNSTTENQNIEITSEADERNDIKNKLVEHFKESFHDIREEIASVAKIKDSYSNNIAYRVGYVLANIDILDLNLGKLLQDLNDNRFAWDEKKLLHLFDKLKVSHRVVGKLSDFIAKYVRK